MTNLQKYLKWLEIAQALITIIGNVRLSESVDWLQVKINAEKLKKEGHEGDDE